MDRIVLENVWKIYEMGTTKVYAVRGVNLRIKKGEFVFIVGPSGSGKTTLLDIIGGLLKPTKGKVYVEGKDLYKMEDDERSMFRRKYFGFVFQAFNLIPSLTALENVLIPKMPEGITEEDVIRARHLLKEMGLERRINHKPNQLSGGEMQRVAIARALINNPKVILADEPTGELDSKNGEIVMNYLRKTLEYGVSVIVVTHDPEYIKEEDIVYKMTDGKLERIK